MPYDMTDSYEQAVELEGEIYRSYTRQTEFIAGT